MRFGSGHSVAFFSFHAVVFIISAPCIWARPALLMTMLLGRIIITNSKDTLLNNNNNPSLLISIFH